MNLLRSSRDFVLWFTRVMNYFLHSRPGDTLIVSGASALCRVTSVLAFFLPLKVILLAGSEGVPRYFEGFISPADKSIWIIALAAGAVFAYIITLWLEVFAHRKAEEAGRALVNKANELTLFRDQQDRARTCFFDFCSAGAGFIFFLCGIFAGLLLAPAVFVALVFVLCIQYALTHLALLPISSAPVFISSYIRENPGNYLKVLSSANFLAGFLLLLLPFAIGTGGNLLWAILGLIILRRILLALSTAVNDSLSLFSQQHRINALLFRGVQLTSIESRKKQLLRDYFHKSARQYTVKHHLGQIMELPGPVHVQWVDSPVAGVDTFNIFIVNSDGVVERLLQQQVFSEKNVYLAKNEELLFKHLSRSDLNAQNVLVSYSEGPFRCSIREYGTGQIPLAQEWKNERSGLFERLWSCPPPPSLVRAFCKSHKMLSHRLSPDLIRRIEVAVDKEHEQAGLDRLLALLPQMKLWLAKMPLYVNNLDLKRKSTVRSSDGELSVMTWGRWTLEPLCTPLPSWMSQEHLFDVLDRLKKARQDIPNELDAQEIILAHRCWVLADKINRGVYKSALREIDRILDNPICLSLEAGKNT